MTHHQQTISASSQSSLLLIGLLANLLSPFLGPTCSCCCSALVRPHQHHSSHRGGGPRVLLQISSPSSCYKNWLPCSTGRTSSTAMLLPANKFFLAKKTTATVLHFAHDHDSDEQEGECQDSDNDSDDIIDDDDDDDDDDDESTSTTAVVRPYGRKSLAWTNKFRTLFPYETARRSVMDLGLRCQDEWDEYVADGKPQHGPYLPNRPDEMYAIEWESWEEFLGLIRPYHETRYMVRQVLRLSNMDEYESFVESNRPRAEGLRIPAQPRQYYQHLGSWQSDEHFFGPDE
jgi:hypothetical protein